MISDSAIDLRSDQHSLGAASGAPQRRNLLAGQRLSSAFHAGLALFGKFYILPRVFFF